MNPETKACLACGNTLKGRADKKFCNDYCRNQHNNQLNSDSSNSLRNVNNILRRNRRILEEMLESRDKPYAVHKAELEKKGYNFKFHTSSYANKGDNKMYYYCYEYGYTFIEDDKCLLVPNKRKELLHDMQKQ